jgi:hypothetical protein
MPLLGVHPGPPRPPPSRA